jgi:hypothetical protein
VPRVPREGALLSVELAVALLAALAALSAMAALKMLIPLLLPRLLCGLSGVAKLARPEYEFVVHVQVQEIFCNGFGLSNSNVISKLGYGRPHG